jgi:colanic acid/amylovoran biosynthesis protein
MKFVVVNSFGRDDKGDAALLDALLSQLRQIDPKADVAISSMENPAVYEEFLGGRNIGSFELFSSTRMYGAPWHLFIKLYMLSTLFTVCALRGRGRWLFSPRMRRIYDEYKTADLVVSVGGGYFITKPGLGSPIHLLFAVTNVLLAKRLGRKVVTAPVSVGPFQRGYEGRYAGRKLRQLDLVLLRESISEQYFVDGHGKLPANVRRGVDSAFDFLPEGDYPLRQKAGAKKDDIVLALTVRNWAKAGQDKYEQSFADLLDHLAKKHPTIKPVFVPQCTAQHGDDDDRDVGRRIVARSKSKNAVVIEEDLDYRTVKLAYKQADLVIGTRFHSIIFSVTYGVPAIAIEYEHKTRGIMQDLELLDWVVKFGDVQPQGLTDLFEKLIVARAEYRAHLTKVMPPYVARAREAITLFKQILKS